MEATLRGLEKDRSMLEGLLGARNLP